MDALEKLIFRSALENAIKYGGKANLGAVLGAVFAREKKADRGLVIRLAGKIVDDVNALQITEQEGLLQEVGHLKEIEHKKKDIALPNVKGKVVMRFAPNPNGAMSFGHSRVALWNWFFVKKYHGNYILRFDDTDPRIKVPMKEAYKWFIEDLRWLDVKPDKIVYQSKRLKLYYRHAEQLIKDGNAYVDTLPVEKMRKMIWECKISDEREENPNDVMKKWKRMFTTYRDGGAILRIKTDINHPDPAVRDWVAFRIISNGKHPLMKARVWPMLNFSSAIDDHEFGVSHILRGVDLKVSDERQKYIYDYFGWKYPQTAYNGKFFVSGIQSTSEAKELMGEGKLTGWDDPRLGTLRALRRRGFQAEAIANFMKETGIGAANVTVNLDSLAAHNREIIDKKALRFFVVLNPRKIKIKGAPTLKIKIQSHPEFKKFGYRDFKTGDEFYVDEVFEPRKLYRFIDLFNFKDMQYASTEFDQHLKAKLIHWVPVDSNAVPIELVMPDNTVQKGFGEPGLRKIKVGQVTQLMRIGFARCDKKLKHKMVFYFAHR